MNRELSSYEILRKLCLREHEVFAHVIGDAKDFLNILGPYARGASLKLRDDYMLSVVKEGRSPAGARYDWVISALRDYFEKGVARDMVGGLLQDLEEGLYNLEQLVSEEPVAA